MPKPFLIGIEIEEVALGLVLRKLHALPGIVAFHMDFDKPKPNGAHRGGPPNGSDDHVEAKQRKTKKRTRPVFEETGVEALLDMLKGGKQLSNGEIRDGFAVRGRSPKSANHILFKAQRAKLVTRVAHDTYALKKPRKKASQTKEG